MLDEYAFQLRLHQILCSTYPFPRAAALNSFDGLAVFLQQNILDACLLEVFHHCVDVAQF